MSVVKSICSGALTRRVGVLGASVIAAGLFMAAPAVASTTWDLSPFAGNGTGGLPTAGPATSSELAYPNDVTVDASGNVYIADTNSNDIEKVTPAGQLSIVAGNGSSGAPTPGTATASHLNYPTGVAVDAAGDVYIADTDNCRVEKVTPAGQLSIFAGNGGCSGTATPGPATSTPVAGPYGVAVDSSGNVYISVPIAGDRVYKVTPSGQLSIYAGSGTRAHPTPGPATSSPLYEPQGLAVDSSGDLFIADYGASEIEEVTPGGTLSVVAGNGTSGTPVAGAATSSPLDGPSGVAVDAAGDLYIANELSDEVTEVTSGGSLSVIAGNGSYGAPTYGVPATTSGLSVPEGVAVTTSGRVYIADTDNSTIESLTPAAPGSTVLPTISGTPAVGDALTASTGTWTNSPVLYTYQWEDCDSSGLNCTVITGATASTYVVASADAGHTIRVVVTAQNGGGSALSPSSPTGVVPAPASSPAPTTGAAPPTSQVSIPSQAVAAGLDLTVPGDVTLPVSCSAGDGCQASVRFTIERSVITPGASGADTIAQVLGAQIPAAVTSYLKAKVSAAVLRSLQADGDSRLKVTVTVTNSDGTVSTQQLWLHIPAGLDVCPAPTGKITGARLGPVRLGQTKIALNRRYPLHHRQRFGFYRFCFSTGAGFRTESPSKSLLAETKLPGLHGRVVLALTSNHHYSIDGVHPGAKIAAVRSLLHLGPAIQSGTNRWYVLPGKKANGVLRVRNGMVRGIGIVLKQLTSTKAKQRELFHQAARKASR